MTNYNNIRGMISPATCKADQRHNRRMVRDADFKNACPSGNWIACGSRKPGHTIALLLETHSDNINHAINQRSGLMLYNMSPRNPSGRQSTIYATRHARRRLKLPRGSYLPRRKPRRPRDTPINYYWPRTHFIWTDEWAWVFSWRLTEKIRWGSHR